MARSPHSGQSTAIRADGVREAFSGFFGVYPDAPKRTETEFNNWARVEDSKASPTTIKRSWATFRAMLPLSDFDASPTPSKSASNTPENQPQPSPIERRPTATGSPQVQLGAVGGITINIELQLPATADAKFFDQFFSSMRKHLIDDNE